MIIARYLISDVFKTFLALTGILLFIALSNRLVRLLAQVAAGEISPGILIKLTSLYIPELIAFLLPLSLFIAVLLSLSRAFVDQEMPVLFACGFSWGSLTKWCLSLSLVLMLVVGALSLYVVPNIEVLKATLIGDQSPKMILESIAPGRFHALFNNKVIFYVESFSSNRQILNEVFIAEQPSELPDAANDWSVITAKTGEVVQKDNGQIYLELKQGARYNGTPGEKDYTIVEFERFGRIMEHSEQDTNFMFHRTMPTGYLLRSNKPSEQAELQWRFALPLSMPILVLLAIPLSQVSPRKGRFAKLLPGIILYIAYFNVLMLAKRWLDGGMIPGWVGLWWVHLMALSLAGLFLWHASGRLHQFKMHLRGR
jgi:lipopolysaccharide export system permease protein